MLTFTKDSSSFAVAFGAPARRRGDVLRPRRSDMVVAEAVEGNYCGIVELYVIARLSGRPEYTSSSRLLCRVHVH